MKSLTLIIALSIAVAASAAGQLPERDEQLVYTLTVFNGINYSKTFSGDDSDTIYLLADVDNLISLRNTLVYFWPTTGELRLDRASLDELAVGTLELSGPSFIKTFEMTDFTYYNLRSDPGVFWRVDTGEAAHQAFRDYKEEIRLFREALDEFSLEEATHEFMVDELRRRIVAAREAGEDFDRMVEVLENLEAPVRPQLESSYAEAPVTPGRAFVLNIPPGRYRARLTHDGRTLEGSEKTIIAFRELDERGVGYEVIPGDKWTRPVESHYRSSVIYSDGTSEIYLKAYRQHEYVDVYYEKLQRNDATGSFGLRKPVLIEEVPGGRVAILGKSGVVETIDRRPLVVQQASGTSFGYRIVPYDPEGLHTNQDPDIEAFRVPTDQSGSMWIGVVDGEGNLLDHSRRQIRIVGSSGPIAIPVILSLFPLLILFAVRLARRRLIEVRLANRADDGGEL